MTAEVPTTAAENQGAQSSNHAMALCGLLHVGQILPPARLSGVPRATCGSRRRCNRGQVGLQCCRQCRSTIQNAAGKSTMCQSREQLASSMNGSRQPHRLVVPFSWASAQRTCEAIHTVCRHLQRQLPAIQHSTLERICFLLQVCLRPARRRAIGQGASTRRAARSAQPHTASHDHGCRARQQATLSTTICRASRCAAQGTLTSKSCKLTNHPLLAASSSARSRFYEYCLTDDVFFTDWA